MKRPANTNVSNADGSASKNRADSARAASSIALTAVPSDSETHALTISGAGRARRESRKTASENPPVASIPRQKQSTIQGPTNSAVTSSADDQHSRLTVETMRSSRERPPRGIAPQLSPVDEQRNDSASLQSRHQRRQSERESSQAIMKRKGVLKKGHGDAIRTGDRKPNLVSKQKVIKEVRTGGGGRSAENTELVEDAVHTGRYVTREKEEEEELIVQRVGGLATTAVHESHSPVESDGENDMVSQSLSRSSSSSSSSDGVSFLDPWEIALSRYSQRSNGPIAKDLMELIHASVVSNTSAWTVL